MKLKLYRYQKWEIVIFICFYFLVFQDPLTLYVSEIFSFVDEVFALLGMVFVMYLGFCKNKRMMVKRSTIGIVIPLLIFVLCGIAANVVYQYQPTNLVIKDLFVNLKFFLSVVTSYYLFRHTCVEKDRILQHTKTCTTILFLLLIFDIVFNIFPFNGYRYGIKVRNLIFGHVTYLAATCVFFLSVFLMFFEKRNIKYIVMALIVLISTLRAKAMAGATAYIFILYFVFLKQKKIKLWHILLIGVASLYIARDQISFYYMELASKSARSVLTQTSFEIMKDYFPIGTGFGTYGSDVAGEYYSPVYVEYGFTQIYELRQESGFFSDTFWPIIIGQTGFIGTVSYLIVLVKLFLKTIEVRFVHHGAYATALFIFIYLMMSSTSEPTFCNAVSIPLAMMLGCILSVEQAQKA